MEDGRVAVLVSARENIAGAFRRTDMPPNSFGKKGSKNEMLSNEDTPTLSLTDNANICCCIYGFLHFQFRVVSASLASSMLVRLFEIQK